MKRRTILVGLGSASVGASTLVGSGAFSAANVRRDTSIDVVPDSDALVGLGPCTGPQGQPTSNGVYVVEENGQFALQISDANDAFDGDGVNVESIYWFDSVFEICNQSGHPVCVDFQIDVPPVPGPVPNEYDFEAGDDAVVFYEGDDRSAVIDVSESNPRESGFSLVPGECLCVGFVVRAFGFDAGTDIFRNATLTINAFAGDECGTEGPGNGDDGDGEDEGDGDEPDEKEDFEDLKAISFVAFCTGDDTVPDIERVDVKNTKDNGEPVEIEWESNDPVEEVVLFGGQEWYLFDVGSATQGTALMSADGSRFGTGRVADDFAAGDGPSDITFDTDGSDHVRCQSSPCYGEKGYKVEESGGSFDVDDGETTNETCNQAPT
ncbi:hypothetical protein HWV23_12800 [Natronomonas halophila]|uniref:hypothetical protein n=1 Tax=Natronomonas halophila TaxID=2747817 RepID=UPI0015B3C388|nr:hypothetical protein [Natronomonas halophila]QLD86569.1 hypothetical protein HWV23_12800 [Natronomonas halophila]